MMYMTLRKKGVALITVLLFMLVAIIAATAIYKWLRYMGESSAWALKHSEAYQASQSGVETLNSWLSYNGNDVGAVLNCYLNGGKKPLRMDSTLLRVMSGEKKQYFSVYLVGADVSSSPYKLQFVSTGTARDGSRYSQMAVFSVNGLYQVELPSANSEITFDKAFYGRVNTMTGTDTLGSAVVNGDYSGNTPTVSDAFLVTGDASLQGGTQVGGGDTYIQGNFKSTGASYFGNSAADTAVLYIGGDVTNCAGPIYVYGDAYFGGSIAANCQVTVTGNVTVNDTLYRTTDGKTFSAGKNLIFSDSLGNRSTIYFNGQDGTIRAADNVMMPKTVIDAGAMNTMIFGTSEASQVWLSLYTAYSVKDEGDVSAKKYSISGTSTAYFTTSGAYKDRMGSLSASSDSLVKWGVTKGYAKMAEYEKIIDEETDTVEVPILLKDSTAWMALADTSTKACGVRGLFSVGNGTSKAFIDAMNSCYDKESSKKDAGADNLLYNGFLVLNAEAGGANFDAGTDLLDGKFIIILGNGGGNQFRLPAMTANSIVMLYMPNGYSGSITPSTGAARYYNYFIYSMGTIHEMLGWAGHAFNGSIVLAKGTMEQIQGGGNFAYSPTVLQALADAGIIEQNEKYANGTASVSTGTALTGKDPYYIAASPRLKVRLESEYANEDVNVDTLSALNSVQSVSTSLLVLPRIIYLPSIGVFGALSAYYTPMILNGTSASPAADGSVTCSPAGISTGAQISADGKLSKDIYTCIYESTAYGACKFYVVVRTASSTAAVTPAESSASSAGSSSSEN